MSVYNILAGKTLTNHLLPSVFGKENFSELTVAYKRLMVIVENFGKSVLQSLFIAKLVS